MESHKAQRSPVSNPVGQYHSLLTQAVVSTLVIAIIMLGLLGVIIKILLLTLIDSGIPSEADFMKPDTQTVFSFPMKSPKKSVMRDDMTAIEQLQTWLTYQRHWCEHKPSVTISVRDDEWMEVGAFVFKHFDEMSGVSFLPHSDHTYQQAPYQECTEEVYNDFSSKFGHIDWSGSRIMRRRITHNLLRHLLVLVTHVR